METTLSLSIESFSYSWLVNLKPPIDVPSYRETTFIQNFDFPIFNSALTFVHADELISNGFLIPIFVKPLQNESYDSLNFKTITKILSSDEKQKLIPCSKTQCSSLRRYGKSSRDLFGKYLRFFRPLCSKLRGRRPSSRIEVVDEKDREDKIWDCSNNWSPRTSVGYFDDFRSSCDSESSIYEAVLHCKNSNGKQIAERGFGQKLRI